MVKIKMDEPNLVLLRSTRDQLLDNSDKYLLPDFPITPENLIKIKDYRQQLRDFSDNNFIIPEFPLGAIIF